MAEPDRSDPQFDAIVNRPGGLADLQNAEARLRAVEEVLDHPTPFTEFYDAHANTLDGAAADNVRQQSLDAAHADEAKRIEAFIDAEPAATGVLNTILALTSTGDRRSTAWRLDKKRLAAQNYNNIEHNYPNPGELLELIAADERRIPPDERARLRRELDESESPPSLMAMSEAAHLDDDSRMAALEGAMRVFYGRRWEAFKTATNFTDFKTWLAEVRDTPDEAAMMAQAQRVLRDGEEVRPSLPEAAPEPAAIVEVPGDSILLLRERSGQLRENIRNQQQRIDDLASRGFPARLFRGVRMGSLRGQQQRAQQELAAAEFVVQGTGSRFEPDGEGGRRHVYNPQLAVRSPEDLELLRQVNRVINDIQVQDITRPLDSHARIDITDAERVFASNNS